MKRGSSTTSGPRCITVGQYKVLIGAFAEICARVGLIVMFTLLVLTPVFKNMPNNAQAAIIISAVIGLFNYTEWLFLWRVSPFFPPRTACNFLRIRCMRRLEQCKPC